MLLFADGFDHYGPVGNDGAALLQGVYVQANLNTVGGVKTGNARTGDYSLRLYWTASRSLVRRPLPSGPRLKVGQAFALAPSSLPTNSTSMGICQFRNIDNETLASVWMMSTGQVAIFQGEGSYPGDGLNVMLAVSSTPCIYPGAYQHLEAVYDLEAGMEVRVNGVTVCNHSGSFAGATGDIAQVVLGGGGVSNLGSLGITMDIDDYVVWDGEGANNNDFMGDVRVYTRMPTSDGSDQEWTPSVGTSGFAMIDNVPPVDATDYLTAEELEDGAPPTRSTFGVGDFPEEIVAARGVYLATRAFKTDAGTALVRTGVRDGGEETLNATHSVSQRPVWYGDVFEVNPATGIVWAPAELNSMQTVIERTE